MMTTTTQTPVEAPVRSAPPQLPTSGLRHDLRTVSVVWRREMIRFGRDRARGISSLIQPLLFLFVLGTGLSTVIGPGNGGFNFRTFLFPGVLATSVMFTAVFSGISLIWDREMGFLREMVVAPVRRGAIMLGKCLGGATVATIQSVFILALAGVVGVPYDPVMLISLLGLLFLAAFAITALGLVIGARIKQVQAAMPLSNLLITPMMFLSGALFPISGRLPGWLHVANRVNPLTYAVDPMRSVVFRQLDVPPSIKQTFAGGVTWFGWHVPVLVEVGVTAALGLGVLWVATAMFSRESR
jgi:ABC-2 type transport system permease protein